MKNSHNIRFSMKRAALCCLSLFILHSSFSILCEAQNVAINATGNQADPSAMLDVSSQTAGVLIPRMSAASRNAISSPAIGLQVFNTDCNELNYWNGTCWLSTGSPLPSPDSITSGSPTALCASTVATYTVSSVTGATHYIWYVPAGATVNSGQGTTSVRVTWGNYSGQVCVKAYDACESSELTCLDINVSPIPPTPGNITGLASVSPGQTAVTYFIGSVSGASVYNWSVPSGATITAGVGTPAITVSFACNAVSGNVSVTAGSNCGNSSPSSLAVTLTPLAVNAGSAAFGGVAIGGSPTSSSGQSPYTYSWSPNSNLSSNSVANPTAQCSGSSTTYTVNVTDANGCTATSSVAVTRNLAANAGSAVFGGSGIGGSPAATGGHTPYIYSWSPNSNLSGSAAANPTAQCSGSTTTYTVTVSDANGCTATSSALVTRNLAVSAGSNNAICNGGSISIGPATASGGNSSSYTYSWSPSTGLSNVTNANPTANPTSTTSYTATVTDGNGCTATSSMTLTVNQIPVAAGSISGTNSVCQGSNGVSFSVGSITNATGYIWTYTGSGFSIASGNNTNSITANFSNSATSGNLTVYGTNSGCNGTASANYAITVNTASHGSQSFSYSGSIVTWTVPSCITTITITANGAQGGSNPSYTGAVGASIQGVFTVTSGQTISILAGQQGLNGSGSSSPNSGGGGGGSYVVSGSTILVIAGGGGGGGSSGNGQVGQSGTSGSAGGGTAGTSGNAGDGGNSPGCCGCSAGAGWNQSAGTYGGWATGGVDYSSGGAGGTKLQGNGGAGGFGGGGVGNYGGGGGGGYSGGGADCGSPSYEGGGGGGSYNGGSNQNNTSGGASSGNGSVTIQY